MLFIFFICVIVLVLIFIFNRQLSIREFLITLGVGCILCLLTWGISFIQFNNDFYFQSGKLIKVVYFPSFVEQYKEEHVQTYPCGVNKDGDTKYCTKTYYTIEHESHKEYYKAYDSLKQEIDINRTFYLKVKNDFGNAVTRLNKGKNFRCSHSSGKVVRGDNSAYITSNDTNTYNYPTNKLIGYNNLVKRNKNTLFHTKSDIDIKYPNRLDIWSTTRNQGVTDITQKDWDIFATKVYELTNANINLVTVNDITEANKLEDAWLQGKKNDINIVYIGDYKKPTNVKVFGWFKESILKYELENEILENGIQKSSLDNLINTIYTYYKPFDFDELNYLKKPDSTTIIIGIVLLILFLGVLLGFYLNNRDSKDYHDPYFWN